MSQGSSFFHLIMSCTYILYSRYIKIAYCKKNYRIKIVYYIFLIKKEQIINIRFCDSNKEDIFVQTLLFVPQVPKVYIILHHFRPCYRILTGYYLLTATIQIALIDFRFFMLCLRDTSSIQLLKIYNMRNILFCCH